MEKTEPIVDLSDMEKDNKNYEVRDMTQKNVDNIWYKAEDKAKTYAEANGLTLATTWSGIMAKNLSLGKRNINYIEYQNVSVFDTKTNEKYTLWTILPEKNHLTEMKTPEEIFQEMKNLIDEYLERKKTWDLQSYTDKANKMKDNLWGSIDDFKGVEIDDKTNWEINIDSKWYLSIDGFPVQRKWMDICIDSKTTQKIIINKNGNYLDIHIVNKDWTKDNFNIDTDMFSPKNWYYKLNKWKSEDE